MFNKRSPKLKKKLITESMNFLEMVKVKQEHSPGLIQSIQSFNQDKHWQITYTKGVVLNFYPTTHSWYLQYGSLEHGTGNRGVDSCIEGACRGDVAAGSPAAN